MKFTFNTGRLYTSEGQVISVMVKDDGIYFHDHSRMISGKMPFPNWPVGSITSEQGIIRYVDSRYMRNAYEPTWKREDMPERQATVINAESFL